MSSNLPYVLTELEKYLNFRKKVFIEREVRYNEKECDLLKNLDTDNFNPLNGFRSNFTDFVRNPQGKMLQGQQSINVMQVKQALSLLKNIDAAPENLKPQLSAVNNLIEDIVTMASEFLISQLSEKLSEQKILEIKDDFRQDILGGLSFDSFAEMEKISRKPFDIC